MSESSELPSQRRCLAALALGVAISWCGAIWGVLEYVGEVRFPLPALWAVFFGLFAAALTVLQVRLYRGGEMRRRGEMPSHRSLLGTLVLGIGVTWCGAIWVVVEKFQEFRLPVPIMSAVFFGVVATVVTVFQVQLYRALEDERGGE